MALPVSISGADVALLRNSYLGPFKSSGGDFYFLSSAASTNDDEVLMWKATDPTSSFTEQDSSNRPTDDAALLYSINGFQVGDDIHVQFQRGGGGSAGNWYARFDTSPDAWQDVDSTAGHQSQKKIASNSTANNPTSACDLVVRSDGDIVCVFQGESDMNMSSDSERIDVSISSDGGDTWSTPLQVFGVPTDEIDFTGPRIVLSPSVGESYDDYSYVVCTDGDDLRHRSIQSDGNSSTAPTLGTERTSTIQAEDDLYPIGHGVGFIRSDVAKIRFPYRQTATGGIDDPEVLEFDAGTDPATGSPNNITADNLQVDNDSANICIATDGSKAYAMLVRESDDDLYSTNDADSDTWTTPASSFTGTINHVSCNIYDRSSTKLAHIIDDNGTIKYDEDDIATAYTNLSDVKFPDQNYFVGPFDITNKYGIFVSTDEYAIAAMKTTVGSPADSDWDAQDSGKRLLLGRTRQSRIKSLWAFEDGSDIHVATQQEDGRVAYHVFDPGTDAWTTFDEQVSIPIDLHATLSFIPTFPGVSIALRSDGDVIISFRTLISANDRVFYIVRTGSTWGTAALISLFSPVHSCKIVGPDASDRITFVYGEVGPNDMECRTLSSADVLGNQTSLDQQCDTAKYLFANPVIDTGDVIYVAYIDENNKISVQYFDSATNPSPINNHVDVSDNTALGNGSTVAPGISAGLAVTGTDVHLLYANSADADIYHDDDIDGGGTTDVELNDAVTADRLSCNFDSGGSNVWYFYENTGTASIVFDTVAVSGAVVIVMTKADWTWTAQNFVLNARETIAMTKQDWNWTGKDFNINVIETIAMVNAAWNWTGQAFVLNAREDILMTKADWNWTGQDFVVNARETITMVNATWNWTGKDFLVNIGERVPMVNADWNWTGQAFNVNETQIMTAATWNWTGQDFIVNAREIISMVNATWSWIGQAFNVNETMLMTTATWSWTGQAFNVNETIIMTAATWLWTGKDFIIQEGQIVSMINATWTWSGQAFNVNETILMTKADWSWAGKDFVVNVKEIISMVNATWTWTGKDFVIGAPTIIQMVNATWNWTGRPFTLADEGFTGNIVQVMVDLTLTDPTVYDLVFDPIDRA